MNEIITAGGISYTTTNVTTRTDTISFTLSNVTIEEAHTAFKNVKSLEVGEETGKLMACILM